MKALEAQLKHWQRKEYLALLAHGVARWFAIAAGVLTLACVVDWYIDRFIETPFFFRFLMTAGQVTLSCILLWFFVIRQVKPQLDSLAARAEALLPRSRHRFVTALQLARPDARTQGMSRALIHEVMNEAETLAKKHDLPKFADRTKLRQALYIMLPVLGVCLIGLLLQPRLIGTLLLRQALVPIEIERGLTLKNISPEVLPAGETYRITLELLGDVPANASGEVVLSSEGQPDAVFPLILKADDANLAVAELPPSTKTVAFAAWFGGSRLRTAGAIRFEPRPVVKEIEAVVILPTFVDPSGQRAYRRYQPQGEVFALVESGLEVNVLFSKAITKAEFVMLRRGAAGQEEELERTVMSRSEDRTAATITTTARAGATAYRIHATDEHGFVNLYPPTRGMTLSPDRPPEVRLLPEVLKDPKESGPLDDFSVEGMPLRLGGQIQVGYFARSPLGLSKAFIVYRVNDGPWAALPLAKTVADEEKLGRFYPELGLFHESGPLGQVEFYPMPAKDPEQDPDGLTAGGRFNFKTSALKKRVQEGDSWKETELEVGDTVEIRVAVYDRKPVETQPPTLAPMTATSSSEVTAAPATDPRRPAGWSPESRIKTVVTDAKFLAWRQEHYRTRVKLSELEQKQRAVFSRP